MLPSIILIPMTDLGHFLLGPTGLISRELTAHTKSILGVDISQGVVDFYNNRFASQGLPSEKVHAIVAELDPDSPQTIPIELKDQKFDLVFVSTCEHIAYYSKINGRFKSARWRTTIFLTSTQKQGCLPPSSHRAGHYSSSTSSKTDLAVAEAQRTFAKLAAGTDGRPSPGGHSHTHEHSHSHSHQHPPAPGDSNSPAVHSHVKYGVAHVGGIAEDDIKTAFVGATNLGLDMSTYEYLPFTTAKIWEAELPIFLAKVMKKPE